MTELRPFYDIEVALRLMLPVGVPELATVGDVWHVGSSLPVNLESHLNFARVERIGGGRGRLGDAPVVDIESFAPTRTQAVSLDNAISTWLAGYPRSVLVEGGRRVIIDTVTQTSASVELPWDDSNIRRIMSTYQFSLRR